MSVQPTEKTFTEATRDRLAASRVTSIAELESIVGFPSGVAKDKVQPTLSPLAAEFLRQAPFYLLATANTDGTCDVSPRGDPAGSVRILDERTLALPDRRGNRRVDSLRNIVSNPHVGLLFVVPGSDETLRVNGTAFVTQDADLLADLAMGDKVPPLAVIVEITDVFMHCARAFRRSSLWDHTSWPSKDDIPTMGAILKEQLDLAGTVAEINRQREANYRTTLY